MPTFETPSWREHAPLLGATVDDARVVALLDATRKKKPHGISLETADGVVANATIVEDRIAFTLVFDIFVRSAMPGQLTSVVTARA